MNIHYLVNTEMLYRHLVQSGCANIAEKGAWFEPSFPRLNDRMLPAMCAPTGRRRFLFLRPAQHQRNLFYFGVEIIASGDP